MTVFRYLVSDVDTAIEFYTEHLGFTLAERMGPAFAIVTKDGLTLWLSGPQSSAARTLPDGRQPQPGGWNRFVIEVENLEERVGSMKQAGVTFRSEIITGPGGQQILADDPSGNPIELFQHA
jgi:catechol 2,3-dioxygenase-like lactoylglutathione lyase family enzyme